MEADTISKNGASSKSQTSRGNLFRILLMGLFFSALCSTPIVKAQNEIPLELNDNVFIEEQVAFMEEIVKLHDVIKDVHKSLEKLYRISVIKNEHFYIFDLNETRTNMNSN
jgi:hypothetical protein